MTVFVQRLTELGFATYDDYLMSPHWTGFRERYRAERPTKCRLCHRTDTQLHHVTYERLGCEKLDDVVPLCRTHHVAVHEWLVESGKKFVRHTKEAIRVLRGRTPPTPPTTEQLERRQRLRDRKRVRREPSPRCTRCTKRPQVGGKFCQKCVARMVRESTVSPHATPAYAARQGIDPDVFAAIHRPKCVRCGNHAKTGWETCRRCEKILRKQQPRT